MIVLGALVAVFTRWWIAVVAGAVVWSLVLIGHADISLDERPLVALLGAANAAVGGVWGTAIRRLAYRVNRHEQDVAGARHQL